MCWIFFRTYIQRRALSFENAITLMREEIGTIIDPKIGEVFLEIPESGDSNIKRIHLFPGR